MTSQNTSYFTIGERTILLRSKPQKNKMILDLFIGYREGCYRGAKSFHTLHLEN